MSMLQVDDVHVSYGAVTAVRGVSLTVDEGEVVALVGANGAGKSSLLRAMAGLVPVQSGQVVYDGTDIGDLPAHRRPNLGLCYVPEGRRLFGELTVLENLQAGAYRLGRKDLAADFARVWRLFPVLEERQRQRADSLSGGEQQMVALGRALMSRPRLLMLDEPTLGLAPKLVKDVLALIDVIRAEGVTVLLVEQNADQSLRLADRAYVLRSGSVTLQGKGHELREQAELVRSYLEGVSHT